MFDPFSGSGTTLVTAAMLGRKYCGTDISADYVEKAALRITDTLTGRRKKTEIAENPAALRANRKILIAKKPHKTASPSKTLFDP